MWRQQKCTFLFFVKKYAIFQNMTNFAQIVSYNGANNAKYNRKSK